MRFPELCICTNPVFFLNRKRMSESAHAVCTWKQNGAHDATEENSARQRERYHKELVFLAVWERFEWRRKRALAFEGKVSCNIGLSMCAGHIFCGNSSRNKVCVHFFSFCFSSFLWCPRSWWWSFRHIKGRGCSLNPFVSSDHLDTWLVVVAFEYEAGGTSLNSLQLVYRCSSVCPILMMHIREGVSRTPCTTSPWWNWSWSLSCA